MSVVLDVAPGRTGRVRPGIAAGTPRWPVRTRLLFAAAAGWAAFLTVFLLFSGEHWWWRPVELAPPLVFAVGSVVLLALTPLARPVRGRVAGVAVCCLAIGVDLAGVNVHALPGLGGGSPTPPGAVRVFSWNTEYWHDADDPERFYAFLAAQRADVYLLQEHVGWDLAGHRPIRVNHLAELRRRFPGYDVASVGEMLTMSRYPIVAQGGLDSWPYLADPTVGGPPAGSDFPDYYRYKILRTDLLVGPWTLSAYNVHIPVQLDVSMDPTTAEFTAFMRAQQDRRQAHYRALDEDLATNPAVQLVAGDFNATSAMGELRRLGGRLRDATSASDQLYPVSWPADGRGLWRLDWAFTNESARVHDYRIVPSHGLSDHRAQLLSLSPA
nr:endonuclease/exonuclease/phosphatase family protein [Micromonospora sp. DSM 115978]